jgi:hypothetical protein
MTALIIGIGSSASAKILLASRLQVAEDTEWVQALPLKAGIENWVPYYQARLADDESIRA